MKEKEKKSRLLDMFEILNKSFGPQHWWPADSLDEMVTGAILTQNVSWSNVEKALASLKKNGIDSFEAILAADTILLEGCIKSAGFYRQKAKRLKTAAKFFLSKRFIKRDDLLCLNGIGKETADSIMLYGLNEPVFVVDAYTKRILTRHKITQKTDYDSIQKLFEDNLPKSITLFNQYHALLVKLAKLFCKRKPWCNRCPLAIDLLENRIPFPTENFKSTDYLLLNTR